MQQPASGPSSLLSTHPDGGALTAAAMAPLYRAPATPTPPAPLPPSEKSSRESGLHRASSHHGHHHTDRSFGLDSQGIGLTASMHLASAGGSSSSSSQKEKVKQWIKEQGKVCTGMDDRLELLIILE